MEGFTVHQHTTGVQALHPRPAGHDVCGASVDDSPVRWLFHRQSPTRFTARPWRRAVRGCVSERTATHRGYDSDHPTCDGDVGKAGVAIDSVGDAGIRPDPAGQSQCVQHA
jgi:methylmalonyl-CoA mutase N-terminal domain/subunit